MNASTESSDLGDLAGVYTFDTAIKMWFANKPNISLHEYLGMTREELQTWADRKKALLHRTRSYERSEAELTLARIAVAYEDQK